MLIFISDSLIVARISLSLLFRSTEKEGLASRGNCAGACKMAICGGILRAMDILIGWIDMQDRQTSQIAVAQLSNADVAMWRGEQYHGSRSALPALDPMGASSRQPSALISSSPDPSQTFIATFYHTRAQYYSGLAQSLTTRYIIPRHRCIAV